MKYEFKEHRKEKVQNFINNIQDINENVIKYKKNSNKLSISKYKHHTHELSLTEMEIKPPHSHRYSQEKDGMSTKIEKKKKLCLEFSSTQQSNPHRSEKSKYHTKAKSFWRFEPNHSEKC
jgi:hypothetical protein